MFSVYFIQLQVCNQGCLVSLPTSTPICWRSLVNITAWVAYVVLRVITRSWLKEIFSVSTINCSKKHREQATVFIPLPKLLLLLYYNQGSYYEHGFPLVTLHQGFLLNFTYLFMPGPTLCRMFWSCGDEWELVDKSINVFIYDIYVIDTNMIMDITEHTTELARGN